MRPTRAVLKTGTVVVRTLSGAPNSTKNNTSGRDRKMHQTKKCNNSTSALKAHIGVAAENRLVHTVIGQGKIA